MTEIKRLNYFTSQFLVENDFRDEQAYHRRMRHLHNRSLHTWGVVTGLEINKSGDKQVSVNNGMAIDSEGKEIVVLEEQPADIKTVSLSEFAAGSTVYITLAVQDFEDEADSYTLGSEIKYTRTTERPQLETSSTQPADDGAVVLLAEVQLDDSGNVDVDTIDNSVRRLASVHIPPGAEFSGPLNIQDALSVGGNVDIGGNLTVSGDFAVTGNVNTPLNVTNNVSIGGNLTVSGNLEITGDVIARDTEHIEGNVSLGNDDNDEVSINGVLRSTHSSGILQIDDALNVTGPLTVSGGNWNLTTTEGDLKIGNNTHRLKIGVATSGNGAGDVRICAQGGTHRLMLGSNTADVLTVQNGNVGIGTLNPSAILEVAGALKLAKTGTLLFHSTNESGPPTGDGFRLRYDADFFESPLDALVIEKTDGNGRNPDGGIAFVNTGNDGIEETALVIRGSGNVGIGTKNPSAKLVVTGGETTLQQESWQTPTLQNGWVNYGSGYNSAGYFKDSLGIVHLKGLVRNGTANTIFTLPVGYRPAARELHSVATYNNTIGRVDIFSNGRVQRISGSSAWVSLDGITFRAGSSTRGDGIIRDVIVGDTIRDVIVGDTIRDVIQ
ncbi:MULTISPECIES: hypothetical protein [Okeania]|uniref:Uncharacterized protein n=1 Tax=Okeania hirsuta TaxID=1458930 RepID=A0A3N6QSD0_9CYAN|nr:MULTISPECIES: hypothetical protein [Okeania]NES77323.1 hypothetical protein [Okeania sp. SIO1H4]NES88029.1 hypothetical protein [Okeania sp. SIO2B9]NET22701.1 hypothetical protein [Okeania sp. SIO1H5]NET95823.1 hypothetical protein [Okeania sp. SIO1H2]RQH18192.1 hypothetical protein D4Z78_15915 [Okeania hirsuta]